MDYFIEYWKDKSKVDEFIKRQTIEKGISRKEHFLQFCENLEMVDLFFALNESKGTIQIEKCKNEYKDISDKIDKIENDINKLYYDNNFVINHIDLDKKKYDCDVYPDPKNPNKETVISGATSCNIYVLNYKNLFDWFLNLKVLVVDSEFAILPLGNAYIDDSYLSCFIKDKILYGTILIGNPLNNYDLRNTIYHEIRHYYNALKTYQSNSHFIKKDFDLRQSNANYDFRDYDVIIKNLHSSNGADHLKDIIFSCFYYLNHDEMEARQENIFGELKSGKTITIDVYNNIFKIIKYLLENNLACEKEILNDNITMKKIRKALSVSENIGKNSLNFVYKKFLKKYDYFIKHINSMKDFLNIKEELN